MAKRNENTSTGLVPNMITFYIGTCKNVYLALNKDSKDHKWYGPNRSRRY